MLWREVENSSHAALCLEKYHASPRPCNEFFCLICYFLLQWFEYRWKKSNTLGMALLFVGASGSEFWIRVRNWCHPWWPSETHPLWPGGGRRCLLVGGPARPSAPGWSLRPSPWPSSGRAALPRALPMYEAPSIPSCRKAGGEEGGVVTMIEPADSS